MLLPLMRRLARANLGRAIMITTQRMQSQCGGGGGGKVPPKILRLQKQFQAKNDLPVFLKGGQTDKILYYTTLGLSGLGLLLCLALFAGYLID